MKGKKRKGQPKKPLMGFPMFEPSKSSEDYPTEMTRTVVRNGEKVKMKVRISKTMLTVWENGKKVKEEPIKKAG